MQEQGGTKERETDREFTVELAKTLIMIIQGTKCSVLFSFLLKFTPTKIHAYNPILLSESTGNSPVCENDQEISAFLWTVRDKWLKLKEWLLNLCSSFLLSRNVTSVGRSDVFSSWKFAAIECSHHIVTWVWLETGFGLVTGFTGLLQNITTNNYDSLTELHTPKIILTTAHTKCSHSLLAVAW
jgi:hypothetical protein